jgi:hypothetical protein
MQWQLLRDAACYCHHSFLLQLSIIVKGLCQAGQQDVHTPVNYMLLACCHPGAQQRPSGANLTDGGLPQPPKTPVPFKEKACTFVLSRVHMLTQPGFAIWCCLRQVQQGIRTRRLQRLCASNEDHKVLLIVQTLQRQGRHRPASCSVHCEDTVPILGFAVTVQYHQGLDHAGSCKGVICASINGLWGRRRQRSQQEQAEHQQQS